MNLRAERLNRGMSLAEASGRIGVTERVLQGAELGRVPQPSNARKIARFYGQGVTDIWPVEDRESASTP